MYKFTSELGNRYKPCQAFQSLKNMGRKRLAGYKITWAKWRDYLVRHHYMLMPEEESGSKRQQGAAAVVGEAVEEVGPAPLTQWLTPAGGGADSSDDDGQY